MGFHPAGDDTGRPNVGRDPKSFIQPLEAVIAKADPGLPVTDVTTLDAVVGDAVREQRFATSLMAGFAILAMVLAAVGIYGVISYSVSQRTREIGVRLLVLGAEPSVVRRMVITQGDGAVAVCSASGSDWPARPC